MANHLVHVIVCCELKQTQADPLAASCNNGRFQGGHRSGVRLPRTVHVRSASLSSLDRLLVPVDEQNRIGLPRWGCAGRTLQYDLVPLFWMELRKESSPNA